MEKSGAKTVKTTVNDKQNLFGKISAFPGSKKVNRKTQAKTIGGAIGKSTHDTGKGGVY